MDKMKKVGKSMVDSGAKTMLKVSDERLVLTVIVAVVAGTSSPVGQLATMTLLPSRHHILIIQPSLPNS